MTKKRGIKAALLEHWPTFLSHILGFLVLFLLGMPIT